MAEQDVNSENCYLVQIGAKRWLSSYVEQGTVIVKGQTVSVGPAMRDTLLRGKFKDPKSDQMVPYFRDATPQEAATYINRLENLDPIDGDPKLLREVARTEARRRGQVEKGTLRGIERDERVEEELQPKTVQRRTRKRTTEKEDLE